jgi:hypothetical protein
MPLDSYLWVAQIASPRTDPAFARGALNTPEREAWMTAALRYSRTRSAADLAALPVIEGKRPRLYAVRVLDPTAYTAIKAQGTVEQRDQLAVRAGVVSYQDTDKRTHDAPLEPTQGAAPLATAAWVKTLVGLGGGQLIQELAAVVIRRYEIGDVEDFEGADPLDLYHLGGLRLGRSTG